MAHVTLIWGEPNACKAAASKIVLGSRDAIVDLETVLGQDRRGI